ncbi:uncharacterized protein RB166_013686 [Leptodactylus fuscus]
MDSRIYPKASRGEHRVFRDLFPDAVELGLPCHERMMSLVQHSEALATWTSYGVRRPSVCFLGHSYIFWAAQRAENRPGGKSLGFREIEVEWRGIRGLKWCQVLPEAISVGQHSSPPVILVVHAEDNNLCVLCVAELITLMRADLERITSYFAEVVLVWSEIVPRVTWQGARDAGAVEKARRTVNSHLSRFVRSKRGVVVRHRQLEEDNRCLMRPDGVHLNEIGLDIFLSSLQDGVEQALFLLGGGGGVGAQCVVPPLWSPPWQFGVVMGSGCHSIERFIFTSDKTTFLEAGKRAMPRMKVKAFSFLNKDSNTQEKDRSKIHN